MSLPFKQSGRSLRAGRWLKGLSKLGASLEVTVDQFGVTLQSANRVLERFDGEPMEALAQALGSRARRRWQQPQALSVTFGFPFARDFMLPWPQGVKRVKDYQTYLTHAAPSQDESPKLWRAGFETPAWGASAFVWAVPEACYQQLLTLCRHAHMRLNALETPLSRALASYRKRMPPHAALITLDQNHFHCALLNDGTVYQAYVWPMSAEHPLKHSVELAAALAGIELPLNLFVASERPDASARWQGVEWLLGPAREGLA